MTTQTYKTQQNVVKQLREIRDKISNEIKDMSFEEERAYLDSLLSNKERDAPNNGLASLGDNSTLNQ